MTKDVTVPGVLLPGVTIPPNWEAAYGYSQKRRAEGSRYLAVWWEMGGGDAVYSDGCIKAAANWQVFEDLAELLDRAGYIGIVRAAFRCGAFEELTALLDRAGFGPAGGGQGNSDTARVLLLDLVERTIRTAPLRATLAWLEEVAPLPSLVELPGVDTAEGMEAFIEAIQQGVGGFGGVGRNRWEGRELCPVCRGVCWCRAGDWPEGGYVACTVCEGGLVAEDAPVVTAARRAAREWSYEQEIAE